MKSTEKRLTTVRIEDELFQEFKYQCVRNKFSFQKLASRSIFLYLTDKNFRKDIHNTVDLNIDKLNE
jgi:hypothetical protein